jgi:hypothetical protein
MKGQNLLVTGQGLVQAAAIKESIGLEQQMIRFVGH